MLGYNISVSIKSLGGTMIKISFIISFFVLNFLVLNFHSDMKGLLIMVDFYFLMIFLGWVISFVKITPTQKNKTIKK